MKLNPGFAAWFALAVWLQVCAAGGSPMAAIVAKQGINLNGNSIVVDSYDSTDPAKSTGGLYDPSKYAGDMGDLVSNDGLTNSLSALNVGDARIYGHAHFGPGGSVALGSNGAIGDHTWQATHLGIEPGWFASDANIAFPDTSFPYAANSPGVLNAAPGGDIITTTGTNAIYYTNRYDHILDAGMSYYLNSLTGSTYVAGTDARLVVATGIDLTQPFVIPRNSAVQIWSGGTSITLSGNPGANLSGIASSLMLYCTPSVTSLTLNGNGLFVGVLVAPGAAVTLNGAGNSNEDFCGAMMVKSVTLVGHFSFHYDEALNRVAPSLNAPVWSPDNQFQFSVSGLPGLSYAVQASTNLTDWVSLVTNTSPFSFSDLDAAAFPHRCYRSVYVP